MVITSKTEILKVILMIIKLFTFCQYHDFSAYKYCTSSKTVQLTPVSALKSSTSNAPSSESSISPNKSQKQTLTPKLVASSTPSALNGPSIEEPTQTPTLKPNYVPSTESSIFPNTSQEASLTPTTYQPTRKPATSSLT